MPRLNPTVDDFVSGFQGYRQHSITPTGWCEVKKGITPTGWHEVKEPKILQLWRILSSNERNQTSPLPGLKYSSKEFYKRGNDSRKKKIEKVTLPTLTIPDLPMDLWCPTEGCFDVPKEIKIVIFEADGYMLERDPR